MARLEKEARKAQNMNQNTARAIEDDELMANTARTTVERNIMANSLEQFADSTCSYQDLINIQIPHYYQLGIAPHFIPTSTGANSMCTYPTPLVNLGASSTSHTYGYSIPPWL